MYGDVVGCDGNTALVDLQGDFVARGEGGGLVDGGGVVFLDDVADVVVDGDGFLVVDAEVEVFLGLERELFCVWRVIKQDFVGIVGVLALKAVRFDATLVRRVVGREVVWVVEAANDHGVVGVAVFK